MFTKLRDTTPVYIHIRKNNVNTSRSQVQNSSSWSPAATMQWITKQQIYKLVSLISHKLVRRNLGSGMAEFKCYTL